MLSKKISNNKAVKLSLLLLKLSSYIVPGSRGRVNENKIGQNPNTDDEHFY